METMSETTTETGTQAEPIGETAPQPAITDDATAPGTEQTADTTETVEPEPKPKQTPWFQRRIDELTREKHEARRQAEHWQAQLRQIQQGQQPSVSQNQPPPGYVPATEVERIAAEAREMAALDAKCDAIADYAASKFKDFDEARQGFAMVAGESGLPVQFLEAIADLGQEAGARVYYELGKNPDEAMRVLNLSPHRMGLALAQMAAKPSKPAPISNAPQPVRPIGGTRQAVDPLATVDPSNPAAWIEARNKKLYG